MIIKMAEGTDEALRGLAALNEELLAGLDRALAPPSGGSLLEGGGEIHLLQEFSFQDTISRFAEWIKMAFRKIWEYIKAALAFISGRVQPSIERAKAMAFDESLFEVGRAATAHHFNLPAGRSPGPGGRPRTCGEVMSDPDFVHPKDISPTRVFRCAGAGSARKMIRDAEDVTIMAMERFEKLVLDGLAFGPMLASFNAGLGDRLAAVLQPYEATGGFPGRVSLSRPDVWYTGKERDAFITGHDYIDSTRLMLAAEQDARDIMMQQPGERVAGSLSRWRNAYTSPGMWNDGMVTVMRSFGNAIVQLHNGTVQSIARAYGNRASHALRCLQSIAKGATADADNWEERRQPAAALAFQESAQPALLQEGLGAFVKNLATGDVESDIKELQGEAAAVKTPEQQRIVVHKIVRLLQKLIALRHGSAPMARFIHGAGDWFSKHVSGEPSKEMNLRVNEAITGLAALRDRVLSKKWKGGDGHGAEEDVERADELRKEVQAALARVKAAQDSEF